MSQDEDDLPLAVIPEPVQPEEKPGPTYAERQELRRLLGAISERTREALRLYEALPICEAFHADRRDERLLRGSNRAGKTLAAAIEFARAVTGQDPHGKYPSADGVAAIVGLDGRHCGDPLYKKLFKRGAFRIIKDRDTGLWRAFRPATDRHREKESKPAPPLIPRRYIKEIAWEEKKTSIPKKVILKNGWEINFYSSKGSPPNGIHIDILWIDEEIENQAWWPEMVARLLDRRGKAFWSATPQVASEHLYNLHIRAGDQPEMVGEHIALLEDNPHIDEEEKRKFESRLVSDEERRVRLKGEFAMTGYRIYPEFAKGVHGYDLEGPIGRDWARYIAVDPGRQVCAVLFLAVPPAHVGNFWLLYDELYIKGCDAQKFGEAMKGKMDRVQPEVFIIDSHAGRVTEMGSGLNVEAQYREALKKHEIKSARSGHGFAWGMDDVDAGILAVREALRIRDDGSTLLRFARGRLKSFEFEIERYNYRKINKLMSDQPDKKNDHLMDCLRYLVSYRPSWSKPKPFAKPINYAVGAMRKKLASKKSKGAGSGAVRLGPGT